MPMLAGVVDFALTHLDSRPVDLAAARAYRAPQLLAGYRAEIARQGRPLTEAEERAIGPIHRSYRIDLIAWALHAGVTTGEGIDSEAIRAQLAHIAASTEPGSP